MAYWYVSKIGGDDSNPGTATEPFKTLLRAIAVAANDDTVWVSPEGSGSAYQSLSGITIDGSTYHNVLFKCWTGSPWALSTKPYITWDATHTAPIYIDNTGAAYFENFVFKANSSAGALLTMLQMKEATNLEVGGKLTLYNCDVVGNGSSLSFVHVESTAPLNYGNVVENQFWAVNCVFYNFSGTVLVLFACANKYYNGVINCVFHNCTAYPSPVISTDRTNSTNMPFIIPTLIQKVMFFDCGSVDVQTLAGNPNVGSYGVDLTEVATSLAAFYSSDLSPGFTSPTADNFTLVDGSPLIDNGDRKIVHLSDKGGNDLSPTGWYVVDPQGDNNIPYGHDTANPDIGSYGGIRNLAGPVEYTLTVIGGTGGGKYEAGETAYISASGPGFLKWEYTGGTIGSIWDGSTTLVMPSGDVTVTAIYVEDFMSKGVIDFEIEQAGDFVRKMYYKDENGSPVDISSYDAYMYVYDDSGTLVWSGSTTGGEITKSTSEGSFTVTIPASTTKTFTFSNGNYEFWVNKAPETDGAILLLRGRIKNLRRF